LLHFLTHSVLIVAVFLSHGVLIVVVVGTSTVAVVDGKVHQMKHLKAKEDMLVERAKQLLDKEEALLSLERQLMAKQEALYWRERCLRSEHVAVTTATTTDISSMPPLIQIQPGLVGLERRRVTLMYQPDRQLQLQQMHAGRLQAVPQMHAGRLIRQAVPVQIATAAKLVQQAQIDAGRIQLPVSY